jgi:hypothetical protein
MDTHCPNSDIHMLDRRGMPQLPSRAPQSQHEYNGRLGLVADQFHNDTFRDSRVLEQAYRGMPERVKAQTI